METGTRSPGVSRLLTALGHEVIVAHAQNVRSIVKTDGNTAENGDRATCHKSIMVILSGRLSRCNGVRKKLAENRKSKVYRSDGSHGSLLRWGHEISGESEIGRIIRAASGGFPTTGSL